MGPYDYIVTRIHGDYADLQRIDIPSQDTVLVARALLPEEIEEGSKLHYEAFEYTIFC